MVTKRRKLARLPIKRIPIALSVLSSLMLFPIASAADTTRIGIGSGLFFGKMDFIITYQPDDSHWVFGFRQAYNETEDDGYCSTCKTREETTMVGPVVDYIFTPEETGSYYASAGYFDVELNLIAVDIQEQDSDSTTALFLGGGYTKWINETTFYDIGLVFNMGDDLFVETSNASIETTSLGGRIIIGVGF